MADSNKRKALLGATRDNRGSKRSKGGSGGKWQTPHQKAKTETQGNGGKIEPGDVGIWATCVRGLEGKATKELESMFGEYVERLYGVATDINGNVKMEDDNEDEGEEDIEAAIMKEVAEVSNKKSATRLFAPVRIDMDCVLFFKTQPPIVPVDFVLSICDEALKNPGGRKSRYANRLTPMTLMDKATEKGLEDVGRRILGEYFELKDGEGKHTKNGLRPEAEGKHFSFAIRPGFRQHTTLKRDAVINLVASLVGPNHKVNLTKPDKVIIVEIYQTICGMSVVDGSKWDSLKRFNLAQIYQPSPKGSTPQAVTVTPDSKAEASATPDGANTNEGSGEPREAETAQAS